MVKTIVFIGYFHEIKTSGKFGTYILIWEWKGTPCSLDSRLKMFSYLKVGRDNCP